MTSNRIWMAVGSALVFAFLLGWVSVRQSVLWLVGLGMGVTLASARFGFTTGWRMLIVHRDPRGVAAQVLLLGLASWIALPLLHQFQELQAALGPPSWSLLLGAFVFGLCMQISDGCGSGTLYKAGMGVSLNLGLLPWFALGSFLGSVHLDWWLGLGSLPPVSLLSHWGLWPALGATTLGLLLILGLARRWVGPGQVWWQARWVGGAIALAVLASLNLVLAGQPWGVVYGFGLWVAKASTAIGAFDPLTNAYWSAPHNLQSLSQSVLLDVTTITSLGILVGAAWVAQAHPPADRSLNRKQWALGLLAGLLLGYSSRLAFGCNVGAMLSGIATGSLHGWIWVVMAFAGTLFGVRLRQRWGF